jgi:hypothetical protein
MVENTFNPVDVYVLSTRLLTTSIVLKTVPLQALVT